MRVQLTGALLASALLVSGHAAHALPFCERFPDSPACEVADPGDPTGPVIPPPVDPCVVDPDACVTDPGPAEPTEPTGPSIAATHRIALDGPVSMKSGGLRGRGEAQMQLLYSDTQFLLTLRGCDDLTGQLAPKGRKGDKFQLFFDDAARALYLTSVAKLSAEAAHLEVGALDGESSKMTLVLDGKGGATLKIKSQLARAGGGGALLKATLSGDVMDVVQERRVCPEE